MISDFECRYCKTKLKHTFVDLGMSPLANAYSSDKGSAEKFFPLHAYVCHNCLLVQLPVHESPEGIFEEYAYFSSYSCSWLDHARRYVHEITERLGLGSESFVVEIAGNDGYLLQNFVETGIDVLNVEPAKNVAEVARSKGIATITEFFGTSLAESLKQKKADLI